VPQAAGIELILCTHLFPDLATDEKQRSKIDSVTS
jgi:hypothetical protein